MAKKRTDTKPSAHAPAEAGAAVPEAGDELLDPTTPVMPPARGRSGLVPARPWNRGTVGVPRPPDDYDVGDDDDDDDDEPKPKKAKPADDEYDDDDDDDERGEGVAVPAPAIPNDSPELLSVLQPAVKFKTVSVQIPDYLRDHDDLRADAAQDVVLAPFVLPAAAGRADGFVVIASPQWCARLQEDTVVAAPYRGTDLARYLALVGRRRVEARCVPDGQTPEAVRAAVEMCRLRLVLGLFDLEEADLRASKGGSLAVRARQLVRALRRDNWRALPAHCEALNADAELRTAVLRLLLKSAKDLELLTVVMDHLYPKWRSVVVAGQH